MRPFYRKTSLRQSNAAQGAALRGNHLGLSASGNPLGNGGNAIDLNAGQNFVIGGVNPGEGNWIAHNTVAGVAINNTSGSAAAFRLVHSHRVSGNRVHSNTGFGIDLGADGVTSDDGLDAVAHPSGHGEHQTFLGFMDVATNPDGDGKSHLEPFIAETNPKDGNRFIAAEISPQAGGGVLIRIQTAPGRLYHLFSGSDLTSLSPASDEVPGTGGLLEFLPDTGGSIGGFYRLQVRLAQ